MITPNSGFIVALLIRPASLPATSSVVHGCITTISLISAKRSPVLPDRRSPMPMQVMFQESTKRMLPGSAHRSWNGLLALVVVISAFSTLTAGPAHAAGMSPWLRWEARIARTSTPSPLVAFPAQFPWVGTSVRAVPMPIQATQAEPVVALLAIPTAMARLRPTELLVGCSAVR